MHSHDIDIEKDLTHVLVEVQEVHTITNNSHKKVKKIWQKQKHEKLDSAKLPSEFKSNMNSPCFYPKEEWEET